MYKKDQQLSTMISKQSAADITPSGPLMPQMGRMVFVTVVVAKRTIREFWNVARAMCFNHLELASFKDSPVNFVLTCKYLVFVSLYLKFMKKGLYIAQLKNDRSSKRTTLTGESLKDASS